MGAEVLVRLSDANGAAMEVKDLTLARAFLKDYTDAIGRPTLTLESKQVPRIGTEWPGQGGVYAGLCRGVDGQPDFHLFVHAEEKESIQWQPAIDWAKTLEADGHKDFALPTRKEQAVLFGNVPELFQPKWYWSCEDASDPGSAWCQHFSGGTRDVGWKDGDYRARAVRRLIIQ